MSFSRQFLALCRKNVIVLLRHPWIVSRRRVVAAGTDGIHTESF